MNANRPMEGKRGRTDSFHPCCLNIPLVSIPYSINTCAVITTSAKGFIDNVFKRNFPCYIVHISFKICTAEVSQWYCGGLIP